MIEDIKLYLKEDPFWGYEEYYKIDNETHRYVWGNCLVNKATGVIDRMISKDKQKVGDVRYVDCHYGGIPSFEIYIANRFIGYISADYLYYNSMIKGGSYWLGGIVKAHQILQEEADTREAIAEWNSTVNVE